MKKKLKEEERRIRKNNSIFIGVCIAILIFVLIVTILIDFVFPSANSEIYQSMPIDLGGSSSSGVKVIIYSDFKCPFCNSIQPTLKKLKLFYGDKIDIIFKHFPIEQLHAGSQLSAEAAECARKQNRFWDYHDALFQNQDAIILDQFVELADDLGLEKESFKECLMSQNTTEIVNKDFEEGRALGIQGTPTLIIDGEMYQGAMPFDELKNIVDEKIEESEKDLGN